MTVGGTVEVKCDVHVELEFVRQTAIKRPRDPPIEHTSRQNAGNFPLTVGVGDEPILAAVLSAKRSSGGNGIVWECRRIKAGGLEDRDPGGVLTVRDQT